MKNFKSYCFLTIAFLSVARLGFCVALEKYYIEEVQPADWIFPILLLILFLHLGLSYYKPKKKFLDF